VEERDETCSKVKIKWGQQHSDKTDKKQDETYCGLGTCSR
jgi:hypothetical protein